MLAAGDDWDVWTDWYAARLDGARVSGLPNEELEIARVMIAEDIWQQGPKVVNAEIRRLMGEHSRPPISQKQSTLDPVPMQGPGPRFRTGDEALIDRAPPSDIDTAGNDTGTINRLRPLALRCASDLRSRLSRNEFPELLDAVELYSAALDPGEDRSVEWGEVWGLGVLLQNAAAAAERKIENRILPALEDPAKTALDSLLTLHGPMILATSDGAKLSEIAAGFKMTRGEQEALRVAAQQVAERLGASPDVITPRASESVREAADTIGQGPHPERGSVYGLATIKNISIVLIGGAAVAAPAAIGALAGATLVGAIAGAPLSFLVVEAVKKSAAFNALVTQLGAKLDAMTDIELRAWLEERGQRYAPFRSFVVKNQEPLRKIAEATPELRWMLRYIDFIVGRTD